MFANNNRTLRSIFLRESISLLRSFATAQKKMCPYEVLGVRPNATFFDIKQAYYTKAQLFHPDVNKDAEAEAAFKQITKAYETLKNPLSRQIYDLDKTDHSFTQEYETKKYNESNSEASFYNENTSDVSTMSEEKPRYGNAVAMNNNAHGGSILKDALTKISVIIAGIVLYKIWSKPKKRRGELSNVQKANAIGKNAVGELVYESPLVFVRDKPVDPAKLQEEMKQKQFRIEYVEPPKSKSASAKKFRVKTKNDGSHVSTSRVIGLEEFMGKKNFEFTK